jgi:hypothetical protein
LQEAIEGYKLFVKLTEEYADEVIRRTRADSASAGRSRTALTQPERRKRR